MQNNKDKDILLAIDANSQGPTGHRCMLSALALQDIDANSQSPTGHRCMLSAMALQGIDTNSPASAFHNVLPIMSFP